MSTNNVKKKLTSSISTGLQGKICLAGDKSISHRSLILATIAEGTSIISNLLESDDVMATKTAMQALGADIKKNGEKWHVSGLGNGCLLEPQAPLDFGNSGTGARLTMGLVSSYDFKTSFIGDESLSLRPMGRVLQPLQKIGLQTDGNSKLPLTICGIEYPMAITHKLEVASAQVKSAILLAGLNCAGKTKIIEPDPTRNHTEIMLKNFGAEIEISTQRNETHIELLGQGDLYAQEIEIMGDPSSAAFLIVAALIVPNSKILIENVLMNPTRTGLFQTLIKMGGDISFENKKNCGGELVADICVCSSKLKAVEVPASIAPSMIDEYPILAIAAAFAAGTSKFFGLEELRVKESDRLSAICKNLTANGVKCIEGENDLTICGGVVNGGGVVETFFDHRIAMAFLVMGLASKNKVQIDDTTSINTSFPDFCAIMKKLGANFYE